MSPSPIAYLPGGGGRSLFWRPVADRLWRRGAPIVFGYPGFGDAPHDSSIQSVADLTDALLDVLPPRFHLVAQSMGNVMALQMALDHPERVESLVLCAVSGGVDVRALGGSDWRADALAPSIPRWFFDDKSDFTQRLPSIDIPALILSGDADPLSPPSVGVFLRDHLRRAELTVVAGGEHWMAHDTPDAIAARMASFWTSFAAPGRPGR